MLNPTRLVGALTLAGFTMLQGCGGDGSDAPALAANEPRVQDTRTFTANEAQVKATLTAPASDNAARGGNGAFLPLPNLDTDRWAGVLQGSAYQIEVPRNWNGRLVMYAHGYRGEGAVLTVAPPSIRQYLVANGYAWAASSYSKNYYDVRAGVEDTNLLALNFNRIAAANGRTLPGPAKTYIIGHSMGGHVTAAAIDEENLATTNNKIRYDGAVPMCGVLGDTELFDFFAAYQVAAQQLAGQPATNWPASNYAPNASAIQSALFTNYPSATTAQGDKLRQIVKNLTGGERPGYNFAFGLPAASGGNTSTVWGTFGRDGTVNGILGKELVDSRRFTYQLDDNPALSAEEQQFNAAAFRVTGDPEANRLRPDGLRWIPKTNARISVPVVSIHTLGDMYVPFSMEQIYKRRADALGTSNLLVQRAIRGVSHCDFTLAEQEEAFAAMVNWEQTGTRPPGDDVLTAATVAAPTYGCRFTRTPTASDSASVRALRTAAAGAGLAACPAGSASPNL